jgi:hypothetical protein
MPPIALTTPLATSMSTVACRAIHVWLPNDITPAQVSIDYQASDSNGNGSGPVMSVTLAAADIAAFCSPGGVGFHVRGQLALQSALPALAGVAT